MIEPFLEEVYFSDVCLNSYITLCFRRGNGAKEVEPRKASDTKETHGTNKDSISPSIL